MTESLFISIGDAMKEWAEEERARRNRTRWGHWWYHSNRTLSCSDEHGFLYEVDLDRCRTSAEVLDWIFQIYAKTWSTPQIMAELLDALHDLLDPQATLCSFGESTRINPRELLGRQGRARRDPR